MSARTAGQVALLTTGFIVTGFLGYAAYFDYMRRHSADFRRGIKAEHKKIAAAAEARAKADKERNAKALRVALAEIQDEIPPVSPEQQEAYFQEQVAQGEALAVKGPELYVESASHFYRALRVYPQPIELLGIYEKVVPPPIFALLIELTKLSGNAGPEARQAPPQPTLEEMMAMLGVPAPNAPSIEDLDDSSPPASASPRADSATSGASWEKVDAAA